MFDPNAEVERCFTECTLGVHLWNTEIRRLKIFDPPAGSFIDRQCRRLGIVRHARPERVDVLPMRLWA